METIRWFIALAPLFLFAFSTYALAQTNGISMSIEKHAALTQDGAIFTIQITCGPFEGVEEFQQSFAGGSQTKSGASSESGIDGMVVCDGLQRLHTARLSGAFKPGPANATAALRLCMLVGDEQVCIGGSTSRRVIIRGTPAS